MTAGGSASPEGTLSGTGSHAVTWLAGSDPSDVLMTLYRPVRPRDNGATLATFREPTTIWSYERELALMSADDRRRPANECPACLPTKTERTGQ